MPCSDVTERIQVVVDGEDRLKDYTLTKRTCGQGVGAPELLLGQLQGKSIEQILDFDAEQYWDEFPLEGPVTDETEILEFLALKHLFALQGTLEVLVGKASGGQGQTCAAAEIMNDGDDLIIEALIAVDVVTEKIKSCGGCGSCGSKKKGRKKVVAAS
jgi:hypothetical protein